MQDEIIGTLLEGLPLFVHYLSKNEICEMLEPSAVFLTIM